MYQLVYYVRTTEHGKDFENEQVYENEYLGVEFRLKRDALRYMREMSKECYTENGHIVEDVKNGLNCHKSIMNAKGIRETNETRVRIEKI